MTEAGQEIQEKSTSEELAEVLRTLSPNQLRFVVARQDYLTDKEAAEAVGLKSNTVYGWNGNVKRAVQLFAEDIMSGAAAIRRKNLAKAMMVKAAGLDSNDEAIRQKAATEIIEWEMGKAQQRVQNEHEGGLRVEVVYTARTPDLAVMTDDDEELADA